MNKFLNKKFFTESTTKPLQKNLEKLKQKVHDKNVKRIYLGYVNNYSSLSTIEIDVDRFIEEVAINGILIDGKSFYHDMNGKSFINHKKNFLLKPDLDSIRNMGWIKDSALCFSDLYDPFTNQLSEVSSRGILKNKLKLLEKEGLTLNCASELEYFLYQKSYSENFEKGLSKVKSIGSTPEDYLIQQGDLLEFLHEEFRVKMKNSGIEVETTKGESAIGQHEINMKYSEALKQADNALILKAGTKAICNEHKTCISYMAKPHIDLAGSSCHLHLSLCDKNGKNVFVGNDYKLTDKISCSMNMVYFLGGIMKYSLDTFIMFAPTINSYKRYKTFSWAPSNLDSWAYDNRTSPFRICGSGNNIRIEYRIPGADANQYLSYSAVISAGLKGIKDKIMPPEISTGNSYYLQEYKRPPFDLSESLEHFKQSSLIKESFTKEEISFLIKFHENEIYEFEKSVTDFEHSRYFNLI